MNRIKTCWITRPLLVCVSPLLVVAIVIVWIVLVVWGLLGVAWKEARDAFTLLVVIFREGWQQ